MSAQSTEIPVLLGPNDKPPVAAWIESESKTDDVVWQAGVVLVQTGPLVSARLTGSQEAIQVDLRFRKVELANPKSDAVPPPDLTSLFFINEPSILDSLRSRSIKDHPYTFVGPVLIAVNPLRKISDPPGAIGSSKASEQPHPYAVAETAYAQLSFAADSRRPAATKGMETYNQSIVCGGESGAGKTESAKMVLKHLVARTKGSPGDIDKRLLGSNPITEAFGNAQTLRNPNSSRFGKLLRLHLSQMPFKDKAAPAEWQIKGATVRTYLLERSRVSLHEPGERNFHVFYQLCAGASEAQKKSLGLEGGRFRYMSALDNPESPLPSATNELRPSQDAKDYAELTESMNALGIDVENVMQVVASVLHLGNVTFEDDETSTEGDVAVCKRSANDPLSRAASLLNLPGGESGSEALGKLLTQREINARGEKLIVKRSAAAAAFARDAVAKGIYSSLFDFVVKSIDKALDIEGAGTSSTLPFIGVLDIFGFESFQKNGFEQLLINYANEALQATFNKSVFVAEAALYAAEGLVLDRALELPPDNTACMKLLGGDPQTKKLGLLLSIDANAQVPQANDAAMTSALHKEFATHPDFPKPHPINRSSQFNVRHYAGEVAYTVSNFVDKNQDTLPSEVGSLLSGSGSPVVKGLFAAASGRTSNAGESKRQARSVVAKFTTNITQLISDLEASKVSFIRCVKPNSSMTRGSDESWFSRRYVSMQLRNLSVPQTADVLKSGLPTRVPYSTFVDLYKSVLTKDAEKLWQRRGSGSHKTFTAALFYAFSKQISLETDSYKLGHTKVFFKSGKLSQLDAIFKSANDMSASDRDKIGKAFVQYFLLALWRRCFCVVKCQNRLLRSFGRARARANAAVIVQSFMRMVPHRKKFLRDTAASSRAKKEQAAREKRDEERRKADAAKEEERRKMEAAREAELEKAAEKERQAINQALIQAKDEAKLSQAQADALRAERESMLNRAATAEQKAAEFERLHRMAIAAKILADAAAAEQREFEEAVKNGKNLTEADRAKALEKYEHEMAAQMAKYEARRRMVASLSTLAKQELELYMAKLKEFVASDQVQAVVQKVKDSVARTRTYIFGKYLQLQTIEGRRDQVAELTLAAKNTAELADVKAREARKLMYKKLSEFEFFRNAEEQRVAIVEIAKRRLSSGKLAKHLSHGSSSSRRVGEDPANEGVSARRMVIAKEEWKDPVLSASVTAEKLRSLLDNQTISAVDYSIMMNKVLETVSRQGAPSPSHEVSTSLAAMISFDSSDGWTVPLSWHGGHPLRARVVKTDNVLNPLTQVEARLFVLEVAVGAGEDAVFWRVAHPFSEIVQLHGALVHDAKSSVLTKEAKEAFIPFPQADAARSAKASSHRRGSLFAFFGGTSKKSASTTGLPTTPLVKVGLDFVKSWLANVFHSVQAHPVPGTKHGQADPFLAYPKVETFFQIKDNVA